MVRTAGKRGIAVAQFCKIKGFKSQTEQVDYRFQALLFFHPGLEVCRDLKIVAPFDLGFDTVRGQVELYVHDPSKMPLHSSGSIGWVDPYGRYVFRLSIRIGLVVYNQGDAKMATS
jgi:hypothetical protein